MPELRALFVNYPGHKVEPVLASRCQRWFTLPAGAAASLPRILPHLIG